MMNLGAKMFSDGAHKGIQIGVLVGIVTLLFTAGGLLIGYGQWKSDTDKDINANTTAIETKADANDLQWVREIVKEHDTKIDDLNDVVIEQAANFEWIKETLQRIEDKSP